MPFVISNKKRIHYKLIGETGPWLILHPPFLLSLDAWDQSGYVQLLERYFRLVLFDPLGQGRSDAPEISSSYFMESRVQDVISVMQEVQIDFAHFFGMGLGGQVGFQMAVLQSQKIRSLITAGAHPYQSIDELQTLEECLIQFRTGNVANYLQQWRSEDHLSMDQQEKILMGNPEAQALSLEASCHWQGVAAELDSISIPSLLFTVTSEAGFLSVREAGRLLCHGKYVILPKIQFSHGLWSSEDIVEPLLEFVLKQRS